MRGGGLGFGLFLYVRARFRQREGAQRWGGRGLTRSVQGLARKQTRRYLFLCVFTIIFTHHHIIYRFQQKFLLLLISPFLNHPHRLPYHLISLLIPLPLTQPMLQRTLRKLPHQYVPVVKRWVETAFGDFY